jgi:DNA-binding MarR family transcriptional regulator
MSNNSSTDKLLDLIHIVSRVARERFKAHSAKHQLSVIHLWLLKYVAENNKPTMRDVSVFLNVSAPSTTSFVETLIKGGFLTRELDETDRRVVRIALSKRGEEVYGQIINDVRLKMGELISHLSDDQKKNLENALTEVVKYINQ